MTAAVAILALALLAVFDLKCGSAPYARPLFASGVALALVAAAILLPRHQRAPAWGWLACALAPGLAVCVLQLLPLGWCHPWVTPEAAALGLPPPPWWTCDREDTWAAVPWLLALAGTGLILLCRYQKKPIALGDALVLLAAADAALGIGLHLFRTGWYGTPTFGVVATFIYKNQAAAFWTATIPLALYRVHRQPRSWWWAPLAILALAVVLSISRGGILVAAVVDLPLAFLLLPRKRRAVFALTAVAAIALTFTVVGTADVQARFSRLSTQGATLNTRTQVWAWALPVIADAGPFGSGVNSTQTVYPRAGAWFPEPSIINHIHSDPLEWLLEYGWAGCIAVAAGLAAALWQLRPARPAPGGDEDAAGEQRAALIGILGIALHSTCDFMWNREIIALEVIALAVVAVGARRAVLATGTTHHDRGQPRPWLPRALLRTALLALAATIAVLLPRAWNQDRERATAIAIDDAIAAHAAGAPPDRATAAALIEPIPTTVVLANAEARLALDAPPALRHLGNPLDLARRASAEAARIEPLSSAAWGLRGRIALAATPPDLAAYRTAMTRVLAAAPTSPGPLDDILPGLCTLPGPPPPGAETMVRAAMRLDEERDAAFFTYAERTLGTREFIRLLTIEGYPDLVRSSLDWLAHRDAADGADAMLLAMAHLRNIREDGSAWPITLYPSQEALRPLFAHLQVDTRIAVPTAPDDRLIAADGINRGGLPMPAELRAAVAADAPPWSRWADPVDLKDPAVRARLEPLLVPNLSHAWASWYYARMMQADLAVHGDTLVVSSSWPPDFIQGLLALRNAPTGAESQRLQDLLRGFRRPHWHPVDDGGRWTWILADQDPEVLVQSRIWVGLLVDGRWRGWARDTVTTAGLAPGLHRIGLVMPPLPGFIPLDQGNALSSPEPDADAPQSTR
jgi:O-antigen ligase